MRKSLWFSLLVFVLLAALAGGQEKLGLTIVGIDCEECAPPVLKALRATPGVVRAELDWKAGRATLETGAGFEQERLRQAIGAIGYEAVFDGEKRRDLEPLPEEIRKTLDIASVDAGRRIDEKTLPVAGKVTVLDYWAQWCSPCHLLDARLQHLVRANPKVAVRRVDVGKWNNVAARQATREFRAEALPYVRVYDASGKLAGEVTGGSWDAILKLLEKAGAGGSR